LLILVVGAVLSVVAASVAAVAVGRRTGGRGPSRQAAVRWLLIWLGALAVGAAGVWGVSYFRGSATHSRTAADIVGTWQHKMNGAVLWEKEFRGDGTCELRMLTGPEIERKPMSGTYVISPGGRSIRERYPSPNDPPGAEASEWHIEFSDPDHFTTWEDSIKRLRFSYERKK
jgi:hypothetical protein